MTEVLSVAESDSGTAARIVEHPPSLPDGDCRRRTDRHRRGYAYVGHQHRPQGTTILDISDPRKPKVLSTLTPGHPWSHSHKARVAGDIMIVNSEFEGGDGGSPGRIPRRRFPHL